VLGLSVPDTQSAQDSPPEQQAPSDVTTQLPHIGPYRNKIWVAPAHPLGLGKQFGIQIHRSDLARLNQLAHGFGEVSVTAAKVDIIYIYQYSVNALY
jgi:hypothetical protein